MKVEKKGNEFRGWAGGKNYKNAARLFGFTTAFYQKGIGDVTLADGTRALDLGCGPGALSFALAERASPRAEIIGIDISEDQLRYARSQRARYDCNIRFENCSMDELPYPDKYFDVVITSMALHETPPGVRRLAIAQAARTLKKGGIFVLVDWSKPKFGWWGVFWFPMVCWGGKNRDNWKNVYLELCRQNGLQLKEDGYINSIARRQVFQKSEFL
jgi:demethylmenaquinone methyltransferase/2-methoxy-6-polyprenyl-1,4-benzoquinol methylase